jgi:hypothetical protein
MEEVRPLSGVYVPDLYRAIAERYKFVSSPTNIPDASLNGAKFQVGMLERNNVTISITELGIYNDGVVINAINTIDADAVMNDFLPWVSETFKFRPPITIRNRKYASNVTVEFDFSINVLLKDFNRIISLIEAALSKSQDREFSAHITKLTIGAEPIHGIQPAQSSITIEPRAGMPFSSCRYFSGAPMATADHLALLEAIEASLIVDQD